MKSFQRFVLLLVSLCLFFNVALGLTLNLGSKSQVSKKVSSLQMTNIKKSNNLLDYDIETLAEELLEEESDSENIDFNCLIYRPFEYSFNSLINGQKIRLLANESGDLLKVPLFIQYRNIRL